MQELSPFAWSLGSIIGPAIRGVLTPPRHLLSIVWLILLNDIPGSLDSQLSSKNTIRVSEFGYCFDVIPLLSTGLLIPQRDP